MSRRPIKPAIDQQNLTPSLGPADDKKDRSLDLGVSAGTGVGGSADIGVGSGIGGVPVGGGGVGMVVDVDNTHTTTPATTSTKDQIDTVLLIQSELGGKEMKTYGKDTLAQALNEELHVEVVSHKG
jgi:hypothetical protein